MCLPAALIERDGLGARKAATASASGRLRASPSAAARNGKVRWTSREQMSGLASSARSLLLAGCMAAFVLEFSHWFPFAIPGVAPAARRTYVPAWYQYDVEHTRFDNTSWTYNTDYLLTAVMSVLAMLCLKARSSDRCSARDRDSLRLRLYSASLLACYGISTLAGGWAHQHFSTVDSLNTLRFRALWYLCVGNVSFASCYMGLIGREVQKAFGVRGGVPLGPWWFWPAYGSYMAVACALGCISFKRPACDIFIAGITQFPSTFYCLGALGLRRWPPPQAAVARGGFDEELARPPMGLVRLPYRVMYYVGFIGNAPLLPLYPLLVQHTDMSLAGINTLLHSWLMIMWGLQGVSLLHLCRAMSGYNPKVCNE